MNTRADESLNAVPGGPHLECMVPTSALRESHTARSLRCPVPWETGSPAGLGQRFSGCVASGEHSRDPRLPLPRLHHRHNNQVRNAVRLILQRQSQRIQHRPCLVLGASPCSSRTRSTSPGAFPAAPCTDTHTHTHVSPPPVSSVCLPHPQRPRPVYLFWQPGPREAPG